MFQPARSAKSHEYRTIGPKHGRYAQDFDGCIAVAVSRVAFLGPLCPPQSDTSWVSQASAATFSRRYYAQSYAFRHDFLTPYFTCNNQHIPCWPFFGFCPRYVTDLTVRKWEKVNLTPPTKRKQKRPAWHNLVKVSGREFAKLSAAWQKHHLFSLLLVYCKGILIGDELSNETTVIPIVSSCLQHCTPNFTWSGTTSFGPVIWKLLSKSRQKIATFECLNISATSTRILDI